ncbi:hypothetical protein [Paenibacillaceae bacterium]|uniref:hypothetical protein n=1 Tax=uncultured Paenibacillus sp. TaxID=227322 RepID=UPI0015B1F359
MVLIFLPIQMIVLRFRLSGSQILERKRAAAKLGAAFSFPDEFLPLFFGLGLGHIQFTPYVV